MKKTFFIGLCIVLTFVCVGCSPHRSETTKEPQTAKERFDPAGLMTPETFEMNKRDVANFGNISATANEHPKTDYYGHQASIMFEIGDSWEYSKVTGFTYLLNHLEREELVDALCLIVDDAIAIYGEPQGVFCDNTPTTDIDMELLYLSRDEGCPGIARWEWEIDNYILEIQIIPYPEIAGITYRYK